MIIYGVVTEESIVNLFLAGIGPGLLLAGLFICFCFIYARFDKGYTPSPKADWAERRRATPRAFPTVILAALVIGGIYDGWFTPTESTGMGFTVALVIVYLRRSMTWEKLQAGVLLHPASE